MARLVRAMQGMFGWSAVITMEWPAGIGPTGLRMESVWHLGPLAELSKVAQGDYIGAADRSSHAQRLSKLSIR